MIIRPYGVYAVWAGNADLPIGNGKRANQDRAPKRGCMRLGTQIGGPGGEMGQERACNPQPGGDNEAMIRRRQASYGT